MGSGQVYKVNCKKIFIAPYGQPIKDHLDKLEDIFHKNNLIPNFVNSMSFVEERRLVDMMDEEAQSQIDDREKKEILSSDLFILIISNTGQRGYTYYPNWLEPFYYAEKQGIPIVCVYTQESGLIGNVFQYESKSIKALKSSLTLWVEMKEEKVMWAYKNWPVRHKICASDGEERAIYY